MKTATVYAAAGLAALLILNGCDEQTDESPGDKSKNSTFQFFKQILKKQKFLNRFFSSNYTYILVKYVSDYFFDFECKIILLWFKHFLNFRCAGSFASSGSLLILFGAEYIGIIFFILYVGAISVVFLFVIMMLDIKQAELKETLRGRLARYFPVGGVLSFVVLGFLIYALANDSSVMYSTSIFTFISQDAGTATELTQMVNTNAHEAPYLT